MSLRLITGSSGQGKTEYIIRDMIRRSKEEPDRMFYLIVPEQFSLEMQKKMVELHPRHGYFNMDVLSFHRLAYRIFDDRMVRPADILDDLGVSMLLRKVIQENRDQLKLFAPAIGKAGFVDELKSILLEMISCGVGWKDLEETTGRLEGHDLLQRKCGELSLLYRQLMDKVLGRFMITGQILELAGQYVDGCSLLKDAVFYFDGFTGFTPLQLDFLAELGKMAAQLNVTVTISGSLREGREEDGLFYFSQKTVQSLLAVCRETGLEPEEPVQLAAEIPPRYRDPETGDLNRELSFLESNSFRNGRESYPDKPERIHVTACRNPEEEADFVLHKVEQMVRQQGMRYRDFAILTGQVDEYVSAFRRKADILGLPLFEDSRRKVNYHSGVEAIRSLFHLVTGNYSYESVFRYLKSGMSDMTDEQVDFLENYCLMAGIRGHSMWARPFSRRLDRYEDEQVLLLQDLRRQMIAETEAFYLTMKDRETSVRQAMTVLYETLVSLDYPGKLEDQALEAEERADFSRARECRNLYQLILDLLDEMVMIFGDDHIRPEELFDVMDAGLDTLAVGVAPLTMDQVVLGDLKRTRLPDIKVLFIVGMNDGKIPPEAEEGGILNDEEKEVLENLGLVLAAGARERLLEDEFYMYLAFSKPSREIWFTCPAGDAAGGVLRPSPLFQGLYKLFPKLEEENAAGPQPETGRTIRYYFNVEDSEEYLLEGLTRLGEDPDTVREDLPLRMLLGYWNQEPALREKLDRYLLEKEGRNRGRKLPEELARQLYGNELVGSVTRLERFAGCPYQYFCIYGLNLYPREEFVIGSADLGTLFHRAMELFSRKVKESDYRWKTLPDEVRNTFTEEAIHRAAAENGDEIFADNARNHYRLQTVDRIMKRTILSIQRQLKDSEFEPDRFELRFGRETEIEAVHLQLEKGNRMILTGAVDRIDICREDDKVYLKVIDYKSGKKQFDLREMFFGLQIQLVVYWNTVKEIYENEYKGDQPVSVIPAGMFYYRLTDPILDLPGPDEKKQRDSFIMSGYANEEEHVLDLLENGDDRFVSIPVKLNRPTKTKPFNVSKTSKVMSSQDFGEAGDYVKQRIREMGERIYDGEIRAWPYLDGKASACDYCDLRDVCAFSPDQPGCEYHVLNKMKPEEVLEKIREEES